MRIPLVISMVVACVALAGPAGDTARALQVAEARAAAGGRAGGHGGGQPRGIEAGAEAAVARLPRSAELIVVVDDAAGVRHAGLVGVIGSVLGPMPELEATWAGLSRDLGWAPDETFDRLLGRRVVLVARGLREAGADGAEAEAGAGEWALISDISLETDQRLLKRLEAAPRDIIAGYQLLAVEGGRYKLALHRRRGADGQVGSTAILGPADAPALLEDLINVVAEQGPASMAGTPACAAVVGMGPASAVLLHRDAGAGDHGAWADYTAVSVWREREGRWAAELAVRSAAMRHDLLRVPRTGSRTFEALAEGALAAAMEARLPDDAGNGAGAGEGSRPLGTLLLRLGVPDELRAQLGVQQAAVVCRAGPREDGGGAGGVGGMGGVAVALALEVRDAAETAALADRYVAAVCAALDPGSGSTPQFGGVAPAALRTVPISADAGMLGPLVGGVGGAEGAGAEVAWVVATPRKGHGKAGGWWVLGAGPSAGAGEGTGAASVVRGLAACVASGGDAGKKERAERWLTRGVVRPAALIGAVPAAQRLAVADAARAVGEVRWEAVVTDAGDIRGRITLERAGGGGGGGGGAGGGR